MNTAETKEDSLDAIPSAFLRKIRFKSTAHFHHRYMLNYIFISEIRSSGDYFFILPTFHPPIQVGFLRAMFLTTDNMKRTNNKKQFE